MPHADICSLVISVVTDVTGGCLTLFMHQKKEKNPQRYWTAGVPIIISALIHNKLNKDVLIAF